MTVGYLNATINRKTWKLDPEIGTDGSSQTRQNPRVDRYGYGFGPPRSCRSGFWMGLEPNWTVFLVKTRTAGRLPGPIANTSSDGAFVTLFLCFDYSIRQFTMTSSINYKRNILYFSIFWLGYLFHIVGGYVLLAGNSLLQSVTKQLNIYCMVHFKWNDILLASN